jgi:hypothetical protein
MRNLFQSAARRKPALNSARHDRRRRGFARELYRAELGRYWQPSRLSKNDRLAAMRRTVTRWDA